MSVLRWEVDYSVPDWTPPVPLELNAELVRLYGRYADPDAQPYFEWTGE